MGEGVRSVGSEEYGSMVSEAVGGADSVECSS